MAIKAIASKGHKRITGLDLATIGTDLPNRLGPKLLHTMTNGRLQTNSDLGRRGMHQHGRQSETRIFLSENNPIAFSPFFSAHLDFIE
jgi:hypothetical protein